MQTHFPKVKLASGISALKKDFPAIVLSPKMVSKKKDSWFRNQWVMVFLVVFFMMGIVIVSVINSQYNQRTSVQANIISELPAQQLQLIRNTQKITQGYASAATFSELQALRSQINESLHILIEGGTYHGKTVASMTDQSAMTTLEAYQRDWRQIEEKINFLLIHQDALIKLGTSVKAIETIYNQLTRRIDETIQRMLEIGNLSQEVRTMETIRMHTRNATRNMQIVFMGDLLLVEMTTQLNQDQAQIASVTQIVSQGSQGLGAISDKDETIQDLLSHVYSLLKKFHHHIGLIQKETATATTVHITAQHISSKGDTGLLSIEELKSKSQEHNSEFFSILNAILTVSVVGLIGSIMLLVHWSRQNSQKNRLHNADEDRGTQQAIRTLLSDMKRIAEGDLTVRTDITHDTTGAIADAINCTIEELHTLVEQVNQAGALVVKASNQAQYVSTELLSAAQHQSTKIEETTLAVLGMAESISEVSNLATESAKVAQQSLTTAERGTVAVRDSIAGMNEIRLHIQDTAKRIKRLGESSQEIGEIIALISDITDQTNVLALNAALQASAAGEAGRGFSVIAQEVQRLAERSSEASKQISELIMTIQGDTQDAISAMERSTLGVAQGAQRSDAAGLALEEIEQVSKQLAQRVTHIFDVTNMQTRAAHRVVANMEDILRITRQNTEGTQKTTTSIKQIAGFASELKASVSNFKV